MRKVRAGLGLFAFFVVIAAVGPFLVTHLLGSSATAMDNGQSLLPPSAQHWLGTTSQGEDVLAQLVIGTRTSLLVGLISGTVATSIAVVIGVAGAYLGGKFDAGLTAFVNVFLVLPSLPLLIIIASYLKGQGGWLMVALIIGLTSWPGGARTKRAQALTLRRRDFVVAAEYAGERSLRIVVTELIPHLAPLISSTFVFAVVGGIGAEAGLDFIGAGNTNTISWGTMLFWAQAQGALVAGAWWWFLPPGLCLALVGAAAGLINFGVDEISDPRQRGMRESRQARRTRRSRVSARPGAAVADGSDLEETA